MKKGIEFLENTSGLKGHWTLAVYKGDIKRDLDGVILNELVETIEGNNLITTVGKGGIMDRLFGLSAVGAMTRIGVGTNNAAAAIGDTALTGGVFVVYDSVPTRAGLVVTCTATFGTAVANIVWSELGMDNGTFLLNRIAPIGPITKTSALSIIVTVGITQT
ncbi:hypothetical protein ACNQF7_10115 [Flavobacterium sp. RSP29]|uniref:hypothetical protein n=1 Tax=Flavobacterium sp. RSP29 TaxID=3401731 RepID=UPI003AAB15CF